MTGSINLQNTLLGKFKKLTAFKNFALYGISILQSLPAITYPPQ